MEGHPPKSLIKDNKPRFPKHHFRMAFRSRLDKATKLIGRMSTAFNENSFKPSTYHGLDIRIPQIGYSGNSRIVGIIETHEPSFKKEVSERYKIIIHYNKDQKAIDHFLKLYEERTTKNYDLVK